MRIRRAVLGAAGVVVLTGALWGAASLSADAAAPKTGQESVYLAFLKVGSSSGQIVADGLFTDAGSDKSLSSTVDKETFAKGSFQVDHHLLAVNPTVNTSSCAIIAHATGPVTLGKGTGIYKNIKGTITATINLYYVTKRSSGGCDATSSPLGGFTEITGSGPISY
jgi:hypothetical protein